MTIISVCGRKGGSGKTTVAVHLACEFAARGLKSALVDCDVQASATQWAAPGCLPVPVHSLPVENEAEVLEWSNAIRSIEADYVVLDSSPHLGTALGAIIGISDLVLIPCGPSGMELIAEGETIGLAREIRSQRDARRPFILVVPTRVDRRTSAGRELSGALAALGEHVAPELGLRAIFSDAFNDGTWVGASARSSSAYQALCALADTVLGMLEDGSG